jgi:S-(hydroxymethyl)glutathione dehydrogenase/alcohol dehydrogenase
MLAAVVQGAAPRLEVTRIPVPAPRAGEALIRVISCGVCHTDLHVLKGEVAFPRPAVLGHEVSGEVVRFGPGTADRRGLDIGDVVVGAFIMPCGTCEPCARGRDDLCHAFFAQNRLNGTLYDGESRLRMPDGGFLAMYSMGGLAEYAVVPITALARIPDALDPITAATLGCAAFTAYGAVHHAGAVAPGQSAAVVAVGGVGSAVVQMAVEAGANPVIAVDIEDEKLEAARRSGATHLVNSRRSNPAEEVRRLTGGRGVDVAFEALGNPATFTQAISLLADGGRMVAIGIAASSSTAPVEITPLVRRGHTVTGSYGARTRTDLPEVLRIAGAGRFDADALVTQRYDLDTADEAYRALDRREITGRAVVVIGQPPALR